MSAAADSAEIQVVLHDDLAIFTEEHQQRVTATAKAEPRSVKDLVESCGVPHPEILSLTVNDQPASLETQVNGGERIDVHGWTKAVDVTTESYLGRPLLDEPRFIADVHLGRLVRYLRMLGLDCLYEPPWDDHLLAERSQKEQRIMLTRDVGLLKRKVIDYGTFLRSDKADKQARQVLKRYVLWPHLRTLSRCVACNGVLESRPKSEVASRLPAGTWRTYDEFYECQSCQKVYWKGAHWSGMMKILKKLQR